LTGLRLLVTADPLLPVPPILYGGIERVVADLVRALRARGHAVALLAHRESTAPVDARFDWAHPAPRGPRQHWANLRVLDRAVDSFDPQVIHSFSRLAYLGRHLLSARPKLMCYQRPPTARTVRAAAALARASLSFSGCSEFISARGRSLAGHWITVPNCVDAERFRFCAAVPDDAPLIFLSRLEAIKGAHDAIAIARAAGRRLLIAGNRAEHGEHARYFEAQIAPELDGRTAEYVGPVDDGRKSDLLSAAAAMLLPLAWDEPFGIVMLEALACGTPVIAFRRGAVPEVVREAVDGFVVDDVAQAISSVGRLSTISRRVCRSGVVERFGVTVVADRYEAAYRELLGE
jgi:glycosyltransferase involved in cell wall biosynthesis